MNKPLNHPFGSATDTAEAAGHPIGELLVAAGRLSPQDLLRVRQSQGDGQRPFGEIAVALGLVTQEDVWTVLAEQYRSPVVHPGAAGLRDELVCAVHPTHPTAEAIRRIRTELRLQKPEGSGPLTISVVGTERKEGRTFLAANLAVAFAQTNVRTLLIDGDMRNGRIHTLFGQGNRDGLARILIGRASMDNVLSVAAHDTLTVMPSGQAPNPQELLSMPRFASLVQSAGRTHDVIIVDTPAWCDGADAQLVAAQTEFALFTSRLGHSSRKQVVRMIDALGQAGAKVVGVAMEP